MIKVLMFFLILLYESNPDQSVVDQEEKLFNKTTIRKCYR